MKKFIKKWAAPVLCGLSILALFNFVLFIGYVPTASMEPAIGAGSFVFGCRLPGEIGRGDIMVFEHDGAVLVKRVAGAPGDLVYMDASGATVSVNMELPDTAYVLTVPAESYFMLGDNTGQSIDSLDWDVPFIRQDRMIARVYGK